jgi:putative ABC transport system permease protein
MFRREWRRQALVLALLMVAVAATTVGLAVVANALPSAVDPTLGSANNIITVPGSDPHLSADLAYLENRFHPVDVVSHRPIAIPGSISTVDMRAENPHGPYVNSTLRLDAGRYPTGPGEVAVSPSAASIFGLAVGDVWHEGGRTWRVVGKVENPQNLLDQFVLVAPRQVNPPADVSVLVDANPSSLHSLRLPGRIGVDIESRAANGSSNAAVAVLALATIGLLFVGLLAVAGFTVMAQRRLRALGMLGSLGASDRHVRLVMLANGAAVGATAAVIGTTAGLAVWLAFAPWLTHVSEHRIDRFHLPWWAVGFSMGLAFLTAVGAAWWPARAVARVPVVAALSGRPPRPQPAHRFAATGGVLVAAGIVLLAFADGNRVGFIITGILASAIGMLLLAPLAIRTLAAAARRAPIAIRLALRDLVRYQARSGAALGAVTLAVGIAATIALSAAASEASKSIPNLPANQVNVYLSSSGVGGPIPPVAPSQLQALQAHIETLGRDLHAQSVVPLEVAVSPQSSSQAVQPGPGGGPGGLQAAFLGQVIQRAHGIEINGSIQPYVATAALLSHFGIKASQIAATTDIVTSQTNLGGLELVSPAFNAGTDRSPQPGLPHPNIQIVSNLPQYTSDPNVLITTHAMQALGLESAPAGWIIQTAAPLTTAQIDLARTEAAHVGLYIETRSAQHSLAPLRYWSTVAGLLLALGVLAMTVGLIRSETANDLRTLTATGASSHTRRSLTAATAGALALLGAVIGVGGAYLALLAWHRSNLHPLTNVPVVNLLLLLVGLPLVAFAGGWLLAGRQPAAFSRQPVD